MMMKSKDCLRRGGGGGAWRWRWQEKGSTVNSKHFTIHLKIREWFTRVKLVLLKPTHHFCLMDGCFTKSDTELISTCS